MNIMEPTVDKLARCGMEKLDKVAPSTLNGKDKVFLNGNWVGICGDSHTFVRKLRNMRRCQRIHPQVGSSLV